MSHEWSTVLLMPSRPSRPEQETGVFGGKQPRRITKTNQVPTPHGPPASTPRRTPYTMAARVSIRELIIISDRGCRFRVACRKRTSGAGASPVPVGHSLSARRNSMKLVDPWFANHSSPSLRLFCSMWCSPEIKRCSCICLSCRPLVPSATRCCSACVLPALVTCLLRSFWAAMVLG